MYLSKGKSPFETVFRSFDRGEISSSVDEPLKHLCLLSYGRTKKRFAEKTSGLKYNSPEYIRILGLELGLPKKSVEYFVFLWEQEEKGGPFEILNQDAVGVNCSGFVFKTHID